MLNITQNLNCTNTQLINNDNIYATIPIQKNKLEINNNEINKTYSTQRIHNSLQTQMFVANETQFKNY